MCRAQSFSELQGKYCLSRKNIRAVLRSNRGLLDLAVDKFNGEEGGVSAIARVGALWSLVGNASLDGPCTVVWVQGLDGLSWPAWPEAAPVKYPLDSQYANSRCSGNIMRISP